VAQGQLMGPETGAELASASWGFKFPQKAVERWVPGSWPKGERNQEPALQRRAAVVVQGCPAGLRAPSSPC
jgi:hypothetical protein